VNHSEPPLTPDERDAIVLAVKSAFTKLKNLYQEITPIIQRYGFTVPSAGVIARDLSEKIEASIVQHCSSFTKGDGYVDLARGGRPWEVKICKDSGLTINQSKSIRGENYIVVNYKANSQVTRIWVLWRAQDSFFSPRKPNTNARALRHGDAATHIEVLFARSSRVSDLPFSAQSSVAKASLAPPAGRRKRA
jgi:hypothetical protein